MLKREILGCVASLVLWTGSFCRADGPITLAAQSNGTASPTAKAAVVSKASKAALTRKLVYTGK